MERRKKVNLEFHEMVSKHEANKQYGHKLFGELIKLFTENGVNTTNLLMAQTDLIYG